ncbi:MAG: glycosyltransferase 87 family protein, partial [Acidobacteriota bacterium]
GSAAIRSPWHDPSVERGLIAALLLVAAPGVWQGIFLGNLSFIAIALALGALAFADRQPIVAGIALAFSVAFKPIAAAALPLLVLTPPRSRARAYRLTGCIAGVLTSVLWLAFPYFFELLGQDVERIGRIRTWSLYRLAGVLGIDAGRLWILAAIVGLAVLAGLKARRSREEWLAVTLCASLLATPLIWGHTLVLFFPVLMMTASLAWVRWQQRGARLAPWAEPVLVAVGWAAVLYTNAGAIDRLPMLVEAYLLLLPAAVLVALAAYVRRFSRDH